jgi:hypothetical protein
LEGVGSLDFLTVPAVIAGMAGATWIPRLQ